MSRIGIILGANLNFTPFYYRYEKMLVDAGTDFDLIIWNRSGVKIDVKANNVYEYKLQDKANNGDWKKFWKFIGFSRFVKRRLSAVNYDYLFFLGTYSGNGILIANYLKKHFKEKYCLDIRDYTYEWFKPFSCLESVSVNNADKVVISSKAFETFLPKNKEYLIAHNIDWDCIEQINSIDYCRDNSAIRISFIGNMRYYQENYRFLDLMANDERFVLQYFGTGCEELEHYCNEKKISNVRFMGSFERKDTAMLYSKTDIINNLYGNDKTYLKLALSNKLYFSLFTGKPILVCKNTYMETIAVEGKIGFAIDYQDEEIKDKIMNFYNQYTCLDSDSNKLKNRVISEDRLFVDEIVKKIHFVTNGNKDE